LALSRCSASTTVTFPRDFRARERGGASPLRLR
jgi:hypothetical protein